MYVFMYIHSLHTTLSQLAVAGGSLLLACVQNLANKTGSSAADSTIVQAVPCRFKAAACCLVGVGAINFGIAPANIFGIGRGGHIMYSKLRLVLG